MPHHPFMESIPGYKFFRQLNTLEDRAWVGSKTAFTLATAQRHFSSDRLQDKLARALGAEGVLPVKEGSLGSVLRSLSGGARGSPFPPGLSPLWLVALKEIR